MAVTGPATRSWRRRCSARDLGLPTWQVRGTVGRWRLRADVTIPDADSVRVRYVDPDGATATCTNSELADAEIVLEHRRTVWEVASRWDLRRRARRDRFPTVTCP